MPLTTRMMHISITITIVVSMGAFRGAGRRSGLVLPAVMQLILRGIFPATIALLAVTRSAAIALGTR